MHKKHKNEIPRLLISVGYNEEKMKFWFLTSVAWPPASALIEKVMLVVFLQPRRHQGTKINVSSIQTISTKALW